LLTHSFGEQTSDSFIDFDQSERYSWLLHSLIRYLSGQSDDSVGDLSRIGDRTFEDSEDDRTSFRSIEHEFVYRSDEQQERSQEIAPQRIEREIERSESKASISR
jgi:translation initiation factor 2B subunit (eIF-2B alpha/beta/delta family)